MKLKTVLLLSLTCHVYFVQCFFEPTTWIVAGSASSAIIAGVSYYLFPSKCSLETKKNERLLTENLSTKVQGQHIATKIVLNAVKKHWKDPNPVKPLVMIFHGPTGTGKNFISTIIAEAMFEGGESNPFYHSFNGRVSFPNDKDAKTNQAKLLKQIKEALESCENSLFVFDEVDHMQEGVINVLVPILDYNKHSFLSKKVNKNKSIFIFLTNVASDVVMDRMLKLWEKGVKRKDLTMTDFEKFIARGIFNLAGGLRFSDSISSNVIDHYIPFLPLEKEHVIECIKDAYVKLNHKNPSTSDINSIMNMLTFGPDGYNLYSESGCKRIQSLVNIYS